MLRKYIQPLPKHSKSAVQAYIAGFLLAVTLTLAAFMLVWAYQASNGELFSRGVLLFLLGVLAVVQLLVQSVFFLHLSAEKKARLTLLSTGFTVVVVLTIVVGSLWIMHNLDYNMMPTDVTKYIQQEENIHEE